MKFKKLLRNIGIGLGSVFLIGAGTFYVTVVSGWFPEIQELYVTTAMTTLNHKYLAEWFIDDKTIADIMERTYVDDSQYASDSEMIDIPLKDDEAEIEEADTYIEEGYELLEEGLYLKNVGNTGWKGYLMLVTDPSRVSLAQCRQQFVRGDLVRQMVENNGAIAGVNAGGFVDGVNYDSNGGIPAGILVVKGDVISSNGSAKHSLIGFNEDNVLVLGKMTKQEAIDANIRDAVDFRPFLIVNGETVIKEGTGGWGLAPRTAIGQRPTGEVIFLCVNGRLSDGVSVGSDLRDLQDVLLEEGCINAAMLDGGSSTVMYYTKQEGGYINKPSLGHERYINNAWIIK